MTVKSALLAAFVIASCGMTSASQTVRLHTVMRDKLAHSQVLLAAVVTSNWAALEEHTAALQQAARDPAWQVLTYPEYFRQTASFLRAADDLLEAAKRKDLDGVSMAYVSVTLSCVQCHRYVARMRMASLR